MSEMDDVRKNFQDLLKSSYLSEDPAIVSRALASVQKAHTTVIDLQEAAHMAVMLISMAGEDNAQLAQLRDRILDLEVIHHAIEHFDIMVEEHLESLVIPKDFTPEDVIGRREGER
jgi:hypothetical protein